MVAEILRGEGRFDIDGTKTETKVYVISVVTNDDGRYLGARDRGRVVVHPEVNEAEV
jgi:hypothetical protein